MTLRSFTAAILRDLIHKTPVQIEECLTALDRLTPGMRAWMEREATMADAIALYQQLQKPREQNRAELEALLKQHGMNQ